MQYKVSWTNLDGSEGSYKIVKQVWAEDKRQEVIRAGCTNVKIVRLDYSGKEVETIAPENKGLQGAIVLFGMIISGFLIALYPIGFVYFIIGVIVVFIIIPKFFELIKLLRIAFSD
jgi:hypothetical protein